MNPLNAPEPLLPVLTADQALLRLPHLLPGHSQTLLVAGRKERGKSWLVREYVETGEPRVLLFEPFDKDFPSIRRRLDLEQAVRELEAAGDGPMRRRVSVSWDDDTEAFGHRFFEAVAKRVRNCLVVVDEVLTIAPDLHPDRIDPNLKKIIFQGRKAGLRLLMTSQRIQHFGEILSEVSELVLFQLVKQRDLEVAATWIGRENAAQLRTLDTGQCLVSAY